MSNLFDILHRGKGEIADLVRPLIEGEGEPAAKRATEARVGARSSAAEAQAAAAAMPHPAASAPSAPHTRSLSLRIPSPSPLLPFDADQWLPSEQYRILRTKISQHPKQPHLIVISSPAPGDGKSVSAINTAAALSLKSEGLVLLLDADLRKSAIHTQLGIPEAPGLVDVLKGTCPPEQALVRVQEFPNLHVMSAGAQARNPTELLDSVSWQRLCATLRGLFRYVILDSPPVGAVADYDLIQAACDGVILVIRPDHTNRALCKKAIENVPKAKFLGVLLNCVPDWSPSKGGGAEYYYYSGKGGYPERQRNGADGEKT